jgi:hypothetical protein
MFACARYLLASITVVCLLFCAPGYGTVQRSGKGDPAALTRFTAADARRALIEMVQGYPEDKQLRFGLPDLRAGRGMVLMDDKTEGISDQTWNCDLARKTFTFIARERLGCQYSCDGVFERSGRKWVARITGETWACRRLGAE